MYMKLQLLKVLAGNLTNPPEMKIQNFKILHPQQSEKSCWAILHLNGGFFCR